MKTAGCATYNLPAEIAENINSVCRWHLLGDAHGSALENAGSENTGIIHAVNKDWHTSIATFYGHTLMRRLSIVNGPDSIEFNARAYRRYLLDAPAYRGQVVAIGLNRHFPPIRFIDGAPFYSGMTASHKPLTGYAGVNTKPMAEGEARPNLVTIYSPDNFFSIDDSLGLIKDMSAALLSMCYVDSSHLPDGVDFQTGAIL